MQPTQNSSLSGASAASIGKSVEREAEKEGHKDFITAVCISEDGSILVSGSNDKTARVWCMKSATLLALLVIRR